MKLPSTIPKFLPSPDETAVVPVIIPVVTFVAVSVVAPVAVAINGSPVTPSGTEEEEAGVHSAVEEGADGGEAEGVGSR